ncbi:YggS family pyridoxal phosphate-dependent enzyme [Bacillus alkalicellulosilyticus]|uniref:YggS family pyridoxal phosphate-dependent enzyme n=1 Tax=Alkalihalobacterium alkalicellulosilyticum TaxID=1912214 RepID=UPI00099863EA|nr:YggS family pyridoxal phosphate-dependent enzyme [Bacillus alkalicellulosilyticus]
MTVKDNLKEINQQIEVACQRANRKTSDVNIIAVTKYVSKERTVEAIVAGVLHLGENRVEGGVEKVEQIDLDATWHFIGSLQSKKVRKMINKFQYIHSLDRLSLAEEIQKRIEENKIMKCFIQVNVSGEDTKAGLQPDQVIPFVENLKDYPNIEVVGLMTMAPYEANPEDTRPVFQGLRKIKEDVQALQLPYAPCTELSMGMSNDYVIAIEEGATFVRLGSSLVGNEE